MYFSPCHTSCPSSSTDIIHQWDSLKKRVEECRPHRGQVFPVARGTTVWEIKASNEAGEDVFRHRAGVPHQKGFEILILWPNWLSYLSEVGSILLISLFPLFIR